MRHWAITLMAVFTFGGLACSDDDVVPDTGTADMSVDTSMGDTSMGDTSMGDTSMGDTSMGDTSMGDTSMGDTSMGDTSMGDAANALTCDAYCTKVTAACTGSNAQYQDKADCLAKCSSWYKFKAGTAADTTGNTLGCRIYHAGAAASNASLHCPHAGPSGGNFCGTWCEVYCDVVQANCTGANQVYASTSACQTACAAFSTTGKPNDTTGDTVQCRIYHAGAAGTDASLHCPHTKTVSATCK